MNNDQSLTNNVVYGFFPLFDEVLMYHARHCIKHCLNSASGTAILILGMIVACFDQYEKIGFTGILFGGVWAVWFLYLAYIYDSNVSKLIEEHKLQVTKSEIFKRVFQSE